MEIEPSSMATTGQTTTSIQSTQDVSTAWSASADVVTQTTASTPTPVVVTREPIAMSPSTPTPTMEGVVIVKPVTGRLTDTPTSSQPITPSPSIPPMEGTEGPEPV